MLKRWWVFVFLVSCKAKMKFCSHLQIMKCFLVDWDVDMASVGWCFVLKAVHKWGIQRSASFNINISTLESVYWPACGSIHCAMTSRSFSNATLESSPPFSGSWMKKLSLGLGLQRGPNNTSQPLDSEQRSRYRKALLATVSYECDLSQLQNTDRNYIAFLDILKDTRKATVPE